MNMRPFTSSLVPAFALFTVLLLSQDASAQVLAPGMRVRVVTATRNVPPVSGQLVRKSADTLWVTRHSDESEMPVPLNENTRIEQSAGFRHRALRGVLGALVSMVVSSYALSSVTDGSCGGGDCDSPETGSVVAALSVPLVFMPLGALIGVQTARENWTPVSATTILGSVGARGSVALEKHGFHVSARFAF